MRQYQRLIAEADEHDDRPIIITMKRGTVIEADHIADMGPYYLVGIEPMMGRVVGNTFYHDNYHPDFWKIIPQTRTVNYSRRNRETGEVEQIPIEQTSVNWRVRLFKQILTINKVNIASIEM